MTKQAAATQVAAQLAESASIVASSHDAIVGMTCSGLITSCNPAAAKLFGAPAVRIVGRPVDAFTPPDRRADEAALLHRILAGETVEQYRTERLRQDGSVVAVWSSISPILDSTGVIVGAATVAREVSALQHAHDRFEVRVNQHRADALHATERLQVRADKHRAEARRAADRYEAEIDLEREQAQHAADRFEVEVDLERIHAHEAQNQSEADRAEAHREKELLQAQLQQSQRLEVLGQLAGGVAHDFNNLLAVILNYAAFVVEELGVGHDGDLVAAARDVGQIQRAAQRASALTHQLLAFARREVVQPQVLNLNDVVVEVQQMLDRTLGENILLHTQLASQVWPVLADAGQMEQVLLNLAVNARDAMSDGGVLTIDTTNVTLDPPSPTAENGAGSDAAPLAGAGQRRGVGRHVRLRVTDTGTGMTPEVIAHAFEPFYTTKTDAGGTGLGLATVYGILTQADATIDIDSRPCGGTTFTILLPVTDEIAVPAIGPQSIDEHTAKGQTILVVEDEEALRDVTERIFTRGGYQVITAPDGAAALDLAERHSGPIDLLVTDVVMPNMLGKEVAEKMLLIRPDVQVLYMSGYAQPVLASQGRLDRDVHLIEKPFSAAALVAKAGHILHVHSRESGARRNGDPAAP